jgi:uncharacterized membrane protein YfcA
VTCGAGVLRSFTGFGFALAAVPVYAFFMPPAHAVVLSASLALGIGVQTLPRYARHTGLEYQWPIFLLAVPGTLLGARLLQQLEADQFRLAIGSLTILASLFLARFQPASRPPGGGLRSVVGLASGLMNGAFAIPGPPIIIYCMATEPDPQRSRAFMIGFFSFSSLLALVSYGLLQMLSWSLAVLALVTYPAILLGDRAGQWLFSRHGATRYRPVAVATCLLIGISISLKALI